MNEETCAETEITEVWSYTYYANGYYRIGGVLYYLSNEPTFNYTTEISGAVSSSCTPSPTPSPSPVSDFTITWSNNSITTGTNQLEILKNGIQIVYVGGLANGSFTVNSSDVITYNLASSTPNYTYVLISVNTGGTGTVSDCNYSSAYVVESGGITFNANGTIDGITIDYFDGCP